MSAILPAVRYVPYHRLGGAPHVVVDGAPTTGTVLTLSHWPHSPTPAALADDLSAQIVFHYLGRPDLHVAATAVSNNHFDQDGLVGVFALVDPAAALARRELLIDLAAAGDFATYRIRDAARLSMVIAAYCDPKRSPLGVALAGSYAEQCALLHHELLARLPELCDHPERSRELWEEEDAFLTASEEAIAGGRVRIEEVPALDLAVIEVSDGAPAGQGHRFGHMSVHGLHPMALHNAIPRFALLEIRGRRYEFGYRYESWVQYRSRRPRPRADLAPLAALLSAAEAGGARWVFDGADVLTPRLHLEGAAESVWSPHVFRARLEAFLSVAPPVWDPYT